MTEDAETNDLNNMRNGGNTSNMVILEPDIGLGDHIKANRINRNSDNSRREESSISFRRFLQSDGNRSTHPDLYNCSRQDRSNGAAAIDPESPDLPDFVQDHLAVEQIYFNDGMVPQNANLPDFTSFMSQNGSECNYEIDNHDANVEDRRSRNRIPLDLPMSNFVCHNESDRSQAGLTLPFDLTTDSSENNITGNGSRLPDFLSDGHILSSNNSFQKDIQSTSSNNNEQQHDLEQRTSIAMLKRDNDRLREELHVLRSVLTEKDDRIKKLEDIVMALEISKLQMQTDANIPTVVKSGDNDRTVVSKQESNSKTHTRKFRTENSEAVNEICLSDTLGKDYKTMNSNLAVKVKEMTNVSERLVRELLQIITDLQVDINRDDSLLKVSQDKPTVSNSEENADDICSQGSSQKSFYQ